MNTFFKQVGDALTIKVRGKSYRPRLSAVAILSLLAFAVYLAYCIFCTATHFGTLAVAEETGTEHLLTLVFGWINCLLFLFLGLDLIWRQSSSHVLATVLISLANGGYALGQSIYRFEAGLDTASAVFFALNALFSFWSAGYFVKKAIDGSGNWLMKTILGLNIAFMVIAAFFSYQILEAFAHFGDAIFWDGFMTGFLLIISFCLASYVGMTSDYDPHPIMVDELGNIVEDDDGENEAKSHE